MFSENSDIKDFIVQTRIDTPDYIDDLDEIHAEIIAEKTNDKINDEIQLETCKISEGLELMEVTPSMTPIS